MIDIDLIDARKVQTLLEETCRLAGFNVEDWNYRFLEAGDPMNPWKQHDAVIFTHHDKRHLYFVEPVESFLFDRLPDLANLAMPPNHIKLAPAPGDPLPPLSRKPETQIDVRVQNEGTIVLFHALTDEAEQFFADHFEHTLRFGRALVVEHRYANDIFCYMQEAGLTVI